MVEYINRNTKDKLKSWFFKGKVLIITGARQVGKTTLLQNMLANETKLWLNADETDVRERLQNHNIQNLKNIIGEYKIVVVDEVQRIKNNGLLLKLLIDNFKDVQFIATGSSALEISETIFEPLTGRHILFNLYPLSFAEMYKGLSPFEIEKQLPFHLVYGNYPDIFNHKNEAEVLLKNLANQYLYKDVLVWKDIRKPELLEKLLKLLAFQIGSEVSIHELANQLKVKSETVNNYIDLLEKSFVVFKLSAFSNNPRKEISKMDKIYFWDLGIRNAIIDNFNDLTLRNDLGALWENFLISERLKNTSLFQANTKSHFWRNYNQSEVDYVELNKKEIFAYEMKWNTTKNHKVSKAFINAYPSAKEEVLTPQNFVEFCMV
jgi:hypothetical protein